MNQAVVSRALCLRAIHQSALGWKALRETVSLDSSTGMFFFVHTNVLLPIVFQVALGRNSSGIRLVLLEHFKLRCIRGGEFHHCAVFHTCLMCPPPPV